MITWQENLRNLLEQKEVIILHGNIRDSGYIMEDGSFIENFNQLLCKYATDLGFDSIRYWGVSFDHDGKFHQKLWSFERIENIKEKKYEKEEVGTQYPEISILTNWLESGIKDRTKKTFFVINYIDKLTPYNRGLYPKDISILITLLQKIIANITPNNRLIMLALQDSMIPLEYYTNSPKVSVMEVPLPTKIERKLFFSNKLNDTFQEEQIEFISNITEGLYVKDLNNILHNIISKGVELSRTELKKIINKYRIGIEEDKWSQIPLTGEGKGIIDMAENWFKDRIIGQDYAVSEVIKAIKKSRAGVVGLASGEESKPKAVFFFAGPTGVGKTYLAKKLAEYLFDTEEAFIRIDMSEFKEEHTISKLIGAPPGYVGYEKGGILTNAVKNRPFSVILFDEIEKAHPKVMDIFLQILDDGRLTDSRGQTVFFTESVIIFTSNIGTRTYSILGHPINEREKLENILSTYEGEERINRLRDHFINSVRDFFMYEISRPELLNRFGGNIIPFNYLDTAEVQKNIIESKLKDIADNFNERFKNRGYKLSFSENVKDYFYDKYKDSISKLGGRGLVNAIDSEIGHLLANEILLAEKNGEKSVEFNINKDENQGVLNVQK